MLYAPTRVDRARNVGDQPRGLEHHPHHPGLRRAGVSNSDHQRPTWHRRPAGRLRSGQGAALATAGCGALAGDGGGNAHESQLPGAGPENAGGEPGSWGRGGSGGLG